MTEKRFWYDFEDPEGPKIVDFKEDKEYSLETIGDFRKIEDLLNEQHKEIQEWKKEAEEYNLNAMNLRLEEELNYYKIKSGKCEEELIHLEKENKDLKKELDLFEPIIFKSMNGMIKLYVKKGDV